MNKQKIQIDIQENKIKQGMLLKQSRHLKQWKERWMVLTKTHLYSFVTKGQYKDPTQIINLKDVETLKSYYKDQYKKQYTFRVQSEQVKLHMSAKSCQQKWAWMTAVQKTIDRLINPTQKTESFQRVRQSIKVSQAVRQTLTKRQNKQPKSSSTLQDNIIKKLRLNINSQIIEHLILPMMQNNSYHNVEAKSKAPTTQNNFDNIQQQEQQTFFIIQKKQPKSKVSTRRPEVREQKQQTNNQFQKQPLKILQTQINKLDDQAVGKQNQEATKQLNQNKPNQQIKQGKNQQVQVQEKTKQVEDPVIQQKSGKQKISQAPIVQKVVEVYVQKIVEVPVQKIIQKIVKIPQIQQVIVEKIVYRDQPQQQKNNKFVSTLKQLMMNPGDNPTPLINFVVYIVSTNKQKFEPEVLQFCLDNEIRRFFSQIFLIILNNQIEEQNINSYLRLIILLYETCDDYFYTSDTKALITILIRQIQMNRSQIHQYLVMMVLYKMAEKSWWHQINYRVNQIKAYIKQIQAIGGQENKILASSLYQIL